MKKLILLSLFTVVVFCFANAANDTSFVSVQFQASKSTTITVSDAINNAPVSATFSNVSVQNNNPSLATVASNTSNPRSISVSGLAVGNGTAVISCHINYTDPGDGLPKSEDRTIVVSFTVLPAPPHGVKLSLSFN